MEKETSRDLLGKIAIKKKKKEEAGGQECPSADAVLLPMKQERAAIQLWEVLARPMRSLQTKTDHLKGSPFGWAWPGCNTRAVLSHDAKQFREDEAVT